MKYAVENKWIDFLTKIFDVDKLRSPCFLGSVTIGCIICMLLFAKTSTEKCCIAFAIAYFGACLIDVIYKTYKNKKIQNELQKEKDKIDKQKIYQYYEPYLNENNIMFKIIRKLVQNHNEEIICDVKVISYLYDSENVFILKDNEGAMSDVEGIFIARQAKNAKQWLIRLNSEDYQRLSEYFCMS